jgi:indolepyruvate ferredoxin oxidoreductase beta subunit
MPSSTCSACSAVLQAERTKADPAALNFATTQEMARWLALWMAFDDIVRVADLKSRASRWQRVRGEVKAQDDDLLKVYDHFKPGAPEFAALLPPALAARVLAWDRRRTAAGKAPWALPLKVGSHSWAACWRCARWPASSGCACAAAATRTSSSMIERWLDGVVQGTQRHWRWATRSPCAAG